MRWPALNGWSRYAKINCEKTESARQNSCAENMNLLATYLETPVAACVHALQWRPASPGQDAGKSWWIWRLTSSCDITPRYTKRILYTEHFYVYIFADKRLSQLIKYMRCVAVKFAKREFCGCSRCVRKSDFFRICCKYEKLS